MIWQVQEAKSRFGEVLELAFKAAHGRVEFLLNNALGARTIVTQGLK